MTTLTYCKGLPTPLEELTAVGLTTFELFLFDYAAISYRATIQTVNHLLSLSLIVVTITIAFLTGVCWSSLMLSRKSEH
jgi:hypothetical protein